MKPHQRLFRRSLVIVLVATAAGLASSSFGAAAASADYHYCFGTYLSTNGKCEGPRHTLTAHSAITEYDRQVCVSSNDHGYFVTDYVCGIQNASEYECGCRLLYPKHWTGWTSFGTYYGFMDY